MADVAVKVGGRTYQLACDDGQEARLASLAARVDAEARALASGGATSEARLLLMSALMVADKLDEAETALAAAPEENPAQAEAAQKAEQDAVEAVQRIEASILRLDEIARAKESTARAQDPESGAESTTEKKTPEANSETSQDTNRVDPVVAKFDEDGSGENALPPFQQRQLRRARRQALRQKSTEES